MKDLELELRIRNNRIKERREALGLSQAKLEAEACLSSPSAAKYGIATFVCGFETMRLSPIEKGRGCWTKAALKLARFFGVEPEELWPEAILLVKKTSVTSKVDVLDLAQLARRTDMAPDMVAGVEQKEVRALVASALDALKPNEQEVIRRRFGIEREPQELASIGNDLGKSQERIRQIEAKALRKLRHPSRTWALWHDRHAS